MRNVITDRSKGFTIIQRMNSIQNRAEEIILQELIYGENVL